MYCVHGMNWLVTLYVYCHEDTNEPAKCVPWYFPVKILVIFYSASSNFITCLNTDEHLEKKQKHFLIKPVKLNGMKLDSY